MLVSTKRICQTVVISATLAVSQSQQGDPVRFFARLAGNSVMLIDPHTGTEHRVYQSDAEGMADLKISPGEEYLSFIEMRVPAGKQYPLTNLIVITPEGDRVVAVDRSVQRYVWCGRACVACIAGEYREGGLGFTPTSAFTYDVHTGRERLIVGTLAPYDLTWATFDSAVYLKSISPGSGVQVFRYDPRAASLTATPFKDFGFSPSGRYYLQARGEESDSTRLYETTSNRQVTLPKSALLGDPAGWAFERGDFLLIARQHKADSAAVMMRRQSAPEITYTIYDVASHRVVREFSGRLAPWVRSKRVLPVLSGSRVSVVSQP